MKYWYLMITICLMNIGLCAQDVSVPVLEREITLNIKNQSLSIILDSISQQAYFVFSYNPEEINSNDPYSISVRQKSVRHALNLLFKGSVEYNEQGKYIILKKSKLTSISGNNSKDNYIIEGYITDSKSGHKLTEVSVYNKDLLVSAITDSYGYFRLNFPAGKNNSGLHISKYGYADTLLKPPSWKSSYVNIELSSSTDIVKESAIDSTIKPSEQAASRSVIVPKWIITDKLMTNARNIKDTVFRNVQLSLFPSLSTNKLLTGNAVNNVSLNLTVGYIRGLNILELGSILNIVRGDAKICQLAGAGNMVGGIFQGFQAAGVYNLARTIKGVQIGGVINNVKGDARFCQLAGIGNINGGSFEGLQVAGILNTANSIKGVQACGVINIMKGDVGKCQLAGIGNLVGRSFQGFQAAGVFNISENVNGVQVGGILNSAGNISGTQISGLINKADYIKGFQLSIFNYSDSCDGIPVGLFSFVRNGYHKIELSADEIFYSNITIRTGVKRFHTILMAGIRPDNFKTPLWSYGYGFGTSMGKEQKLMYDIDLSVQQIIKGNYIAFDNFLFKLYFGIDRKITTKTSIAAGITCNFFVSDTNNPEYSENYASITPYYFSNTTNHNDVNIKTWLGGKIAVRFF